MSSSTPSQQEHGNPQRTASNPKTASAASKWGSFFQGAVAGLESRLDTILAEDGGTAANGGSAAEEKGEEVASAGMKMRSVPVSASVIRSGSFKSDQKEAQRGLFFFFLFSRSTDLPLIQIVKYAIRRC